MGEYVVIQVHGGRPDSEWTDYSRCTAGEAVGFMASAKASGSDKAWRAVHWIYKETVLSGAMLADMITFPEAYANRPPGPGIEISEREQQLLGEVLFNALTESHESQWSDYENVVATLRKIAPAHILKLWDARN